MFDFRKKIGILFQFVDDQLIKNTVIEDVMFGIKNFYPYFKAEEKAKEYLKMVGLDDWFYNRNPFELSGGEKKLVAIAGILSYEPKLLILDEITSGLDRVLKKKIMEIIKKIQIIKKIKIILVNHDMEIVLQYADKMFLINDGKIVKEGDPKIIFQNSDIEELGISMPNIFKFTNLLKKNGYKISDCNISIDRVIKKIQDANK